MTTNERLLASSFEEVWQEILESYHREKDKAYLLKNLLDFQQFAENRYPDWLEILALGEMASDTLGIDTGYIRHLLNVACFNFCKTKINTELLGLNNE